MKPKLLLVSIVTLLATLPAYASNDPVKKYCSENGTYCVFVHVGWHDDERMERDRAGREDPNSVDFGDYWVAPYGELVLRTSAVDYVPLVRFEFPESQAPTDAAVANDGWRFVTLNQRHPGDSVFVWDGFGNIQASHPLSDLLSEWDIESFKGLPGDLDARGPTPKAWEGDVSIQPGSRILKLRIESKSVKDEKLGRYVGGIATIEIDLETFEVLTPKEDHFPRRRLRPEAEILTDKIASPEGPWTDWSCREESDIQEGQLSKPVLTEELLNARGHAPLPEAPKIAMQARISGTNLVEVEVDPSGSVRCVRTSGVGVFGIWQALHEAILEWEFAPFEIDGRPRSVTGTFTMRVGREEYVEYPEGFVFDRSEQEDERE